MDIGSIFLILGLLILVGVFVGRPFFGRRAAQVSATEREVSTLLAERDRILNALQELDFDFTLGKIPEGEYPNQRPGLLQRGAEVLRQLDSHPAGSAEMDMEAGLEGTGSRRGEVTRCLLRAPVTTQSPGRGLRTVHSVAVALAGQWQH